MRGHSHSGFTLIELSIVLVIIGLIVGGVLVGQDLIYIAQIRKTISQVTQTQTAINTFRTKYAGLPGDMSNATQYWATAVNGDGNGLLDTDLEAYNFWSDLSFAQMIDGNFAPVTVDPPAAIPLPVPRSGLPGTFLTVHYPVTNWSAGPRENIIVLGKFTGQADGITLLAMIAGNPDLYGIMPLDAQVLDQKMDDGLPLSGIVDSALPEISTTGFDCPDPSGSNNYNITQKNQNCIIWIDMNR